MCNGHFLWIAGLSRQFFGRTATYFVICLMCSRVTKIELVSSMQSISLLWRGVCTVFAILTPEQTCHKIKQEIQIERERSGGGGMGETGIERSIVICKIAAHADLFTNNIILRINYWLQTRCLRFQLYRSEGILCIISDSIFLVDDDDGKY